MKKPAIFPIDLKYLGIFILGLLISCSADKKTSDEQTEAEVTEPAEEWIALFDGETLNGWKRYNADEIGPLWSVEDGAIKCDGEGLGEGSGECRHDPLSGTARLAGVDC